LFPQKELLFLDYPFVVRQLSSVFQDLLIERWTVALETPQRFAILDKLIPDTRSRTITARSILSGAQPTLRPSILVFRIPGSMRSTISGEDKHRPAHSTASGQS
jgi:hypothetical protein